MYTNLPRLESALEIMVCMLSQHHATELRTACMVAVLACGVEADRLPRVCCMALGYGLPPLVTSNMSCACGLLWGQAHQLQDDVSAIEQLHFKPDEAPPHVLLAVFPGLRSIAIGMSAPVLASSDRQWKALDDVQHRLQTMCV